MVNLESPILKEPGARGVGEEAERLAELRDQGLRSGLDQGPAGSGPGGGGNEAERRQPTIHPVRLTRGNEGVERVEGAMGRLPVTRVDVDHRGEPEHVGHPLLAPIGVCLHIPERHQRRRQSLAVPSMFAKRGVPALPACRTHSPCLPQSQSAVGPERIPSQGWTLPDAGPPRL